MDDEGYISCGSCHFEGIDDGRVYDFSIRGEGLRNTLALLGRAGTAQGRLNWAATLDEVQDFEHQIRDLFGGQGFMPDDVFHVGTRDQPLGDPKAGLSPELDALAAYVASLDHVNPSPYRNPDGSLTTDGVAGKALFEKLGCDFCHEGPGFTDSARGLLHDVGTMTALSGMRAGGPLLRFRHPHVARRLGDGPLSSRRLCAHVARCPHHEEPERPARVRQLPVVAAGRSARRLPAADRQRAARAAIAVRSAFGRGRWACTGTARVGPSPAAAPASSLYPAEAANQDSARFFSSSGRSLS